MYPPKAKSSLVCLVILLAISIFGNVSSPALAGDAKYLLNEANKTLREAQRDMFSGKTDKAVASLEKIKGLLDEAKSADPNNPRIETTENKYLKLIKDLERRTGRDLGGGTTTTGGGTPAELPPKPEAEPMASKSSQAAAPEKAGAPSAKVPYAARQPLGQANQALSSVEDNLKKLADPNWPGGKEGVVKNLDAKLSYAKKMLDEAKKEAAKKGVSSHPDFDEVEAKIAEAEKRVAEAKSGYKEAKAAEAAQAVEVDADVKALKAEYDRVSPLLEKATGVAIYYNDLKPAEELIGKIEDFEKNDIPKLKPAMEAFTSKYGSTKDEIDKKADSMGYVGTYYRASFAYTQLAEGIANVAKTRTVMADDLVRRAREMMDHAGSGIHDFGRIENQNRIKAYGLMAARYDAESPRVKEFTAGMEDWVQKDLKALNAKIDKATLPGRAANAPDDSDALTKVAHDFLQKEADKEAAKGKEGRKVLAVVITGPWRVFKKNLLGEPIQYGLPIVSAEQAESEKGLNMARVYQGTLLTEEYKGVKMAPPFIGAAVGDSYYVRPSAVK